MGMIGLIIALPLTTLIISYYKRFVLNEKKAEDKESIENNNIEPESIHIEE
jgi:predicted PurR-regulated permease PerM